MIAEAATRLLNASERGIPCEPVRDLIGSTDIDAAYRVQQHIVRHRIDGGARRIGRKIGLTSAVVREQVGVTEPDFGVLLDDMRFPDGGVIPASRLLQPRVEAEIAFVLAADIDPAQPADVPITVDQTRAAIDYAAAALEIVDSRIHNWDLTITDTVADNASSGVFVLGDRALPIALIEPAHITMTMGTGDDSRASTGRGADSLGDPLAALAWLATTARRLGDPLRAGEVILSGALGPLVHPAPGSTVTAEFTELGSVSVTFEESNNG